MFECKMAKWFIGVWRLFGVVLDALPMEKLSKEVLLEQGVSLSKKEDLTLLFHDVLSCSGSGLLGEISVLSF